jgi:hypothetical protein
MGRAAAACAAALLLLCACVSALPAPLVVAPRQLSLANAPSWALAAFDLPAGADLAVTLRPAVGGGAAVASGAATADGGGAATVALSLAQGVLPPPGLYTLVAASTAAAWRQSANVTLVGTAPFVVRPWRLSLRKPLLRCASCVSC